MAAIYREPAWPIVSARLVSELFLQSPNKYLLSSCFVPVMSGEPGRNW